MTVRNAARFPEGAVRAAMTLDWPAFDALHARARTGQDAGPEFESEYARLAESHPEGVADWDGGLAVLLAANVPTRGRRAGAVRRHHPPTLEQSRSFTTLREAGVPVADAPADEDVTLADVAEAIVDAANRISPIPLKATPDKDGNVSASSLESLIETAENLGAEAAASDAELGGVPLKNGPSAAMVESARKIREAAAARRAGRGRLS
jgi:hypothetical protein